MSEAASNIEGLLRQALSPIDPPDDLAGRLEVTLTNLTEIAAEELEAWELSSMRDPRNWARPAAAILVGGGAGAALVLLRARRRATEPPGGLHGARVSTERALGDLRAQTRRLLGGGR